VERDVSDASGDYILVALCGVNTGDRWSSSTRPTATPRSRTRRRAVPDERPATDWISTTELRAEDIHRHKSRPGVSYSRASLRRTLRCLRFARR